MSKLLPWKHDCYLIGQNLRVYLFDRQEFLFMVHYIVSFIFLSSLRTTLCVRFKSEVVACGVVYAAARRFQGATP